MLRRLASICLVLLLIAAFAWPAAGKTHVQGAPRVLPGPPFFHICVLYRPVRPRYHSEVPRPEPGPIYLHEDNGV